VVTAREKSLNILFISNYSYVNQLILVSEEIACLSLSISMIRHIKIHWNADAFW